MIRTNQLLQFLKVVGRFKAVNVEKIKITAIINVT